MSHLLFSPPLIFLVLCDDVERRPFLRDLLKCISNHNIHLPGNMFNGDNELKDLPLSDKEIKWHNILELHYQDTCHFLFNLDVLIMVLYHYY